MKQLVKLMLLLFTCPLFGIAQTEGSAGIRWTEGMSWERVKEQAKRENKFIFVDAYATWCGPCKKMDNEVYTDNEVGNLINSKFISVRLQMDKTDHDDEATKTWLVFADALAKKYEIDGYPYFLFFKPDGELLYKVAGYHGTDSFIEVANDALTDPEARYKKNLGLFSSGQLKPAAMIELAKTAKDKKDRKKAIEIVKQFKETYLDKASMDEVIQKDNLRILVEYPWELIRVDDRYFNLFFQQPGTGRLSDGREN